jgi:hypothetical protein
MSFETLLGEPDNFRIRAGTVSADPMSDWRLGPQLDLVLAVAIAVWEAERRPYFPPELSRRVKKVPLFPERW